MIFGAQLAFFKKVRVVRATICLRRQVCGMFCADDRLDLFWQCEAERRYDRGGKSNGRGENGLEGSLAHFK